VAKAWAVWHEQVAFAEPFVRTTELDVIGQDAARRPILPARTAGSHDRGRRHDGHADVLRARSDGRVGR
jgi:hypothetical protein